MGNFCGPSTYKSKESTYFINEEDYIIKDKKFKYLSLNANPSRYLPTLKPSLKSLLNINPITSFLPTNKYFKKQTPSSTSIPFTDELFPPNQQSLTTLRPIDEENVTEQEMSELKKLHWEKANKLFRTDNYVLYDTLDVEDVAQGSLGNCYFLSVLSTLASSPDIYDKVFIDKERPENNCYRVSFHIKGIPKIVCVDDYFPSDSKNNFAFAMSGRRELWVQVLEKAWAKINGSYAGTIAGLPSESFSCLSEAPCVTYFHRRYTNEQLWMILKREKTRGFYIATNTNAMNSNLEEQIGLVSGHAYSITNLYEFEIPSKQVDNEGKPLPNEILRLIQLRNPWSWYEWKGNFNDNSDSWNVIPDLKQKVGLCKKDDGLFFMDFTDFLKYFPYTYVLKYYKNNKYCYQKLEQHSQLHMACAKFTLKQSMAVDIGLHQKQQRFYSKIPNYQVQPARIIVAQYNKTKQQYTFIGSDFNTNDVLYAETDFKLNAGEYHVFLNSTWPYDTPIHYTVSTYANSEVQLTELNRNDIPSNYLEQILINYLDKYTRKSTLSKYCSIQISNKDNNTGFYMLLISNKCDKKFIFRCNCLYYGCHFLQSDFIKSREYTKKEGSKFEYTKDLVELPLMPHERKLLVWRLIKNPYECKLSVEKKKLFEYKEDVFDISNVELFEDIRNCYSEMQCKMIENDIEYTEVESEDYICLVFRNVTNVKKNYLLEITFEEVVNLSTDEAGGDAVVLILNSEQCQVVKLNKVVKGEKCDFTFSYCVGLVKKN